MKQTKIFYSILSILIIILIWYILSLNFNQIIIPSIPSVISALKDILTSQHLLHMIILTIYRLLLGLLFGIIIGITLGILMGLSKPINYLINPILSIIQTIPPVTWVVLALLWFGFNGRPVIFILAMSTIPLIAINLIEGINNVDQGLLEMAQIFKFSRQKRIRYIIIPSILPYFKSAFKVVLGSGWKIAIMAEVLTTSDGIGGMIRMARINIETNYVLAWAIIIVILYYIVDFVLFKLLFKEENNNVNSK